MLSFLGGFLSGIVTKLIEWFGIFRAGENAQKAKADAALLQMAKDDAIIDAYVSTLSDDAKRQFLRDPANYGQPVPDSVTQILKRRH